MIVHFAIGLLGNTMLFASGPGTVPLTVPAPHAITQHPLLVTPGAESTVESAEPLPRIVRKRIEEAAGEAPVHHMAIGNLHGTTVYTARFTDALSGIEQLITVAPDGRIMFLEPFLFIAPCRNEPPDTVHKAESITIHAPLPRTAPTGIR